MSDHHREVAPPRFETPERDVAGPEPPPRLRAVPPGASVSSYHAVLRHEECLGALPESDFEVEIPPHRRGFRWPAVSWWGAGLAASAVITPLAYFLAPGSSSHFAVLAALTTMAGILGARAGAEVTRREVEVWLSRLARRTERVLRGEPPAEHRSRPPFLSSLQVIGEDFEEELEGHVRRERDAFISTITTLVAALEARDTTTQNHSARVAKFAVRLGNAMNLSREQLYEIHLAGLLHDVGKIGIPDAILLKPSGLTRQEYETMKTHPVLGARILSAVPGLEHVAEIVLHHHEMWDGHGYPSGLAGQDIPLGSRIISTGDTYLSMVEDRPYRTGAPLEKVMKEIQRVSGTQLDPDVVIALQGMLYREVELFGSPLVGHFAASEEQEAA